MSRKPKYQSDNSDLPSIVDKVKQPDSVHIPSPVLHPNYTVYPEVYKVQSTNNIRDLLNIYVFTMALILVGQWSCGHRDERRVRQVLWSRKNI